VKPIFVGGCGRSGTTMLASMLARHPAAIAPPEAQFFLHGLAAYEREPLPERRLEAFAAEIAGGWRYRIWELPASLPAELASRCGSPAEVMGELARAYADRAGAGERASFWVDHLPPNIGYAETLFGQFPEARMLHVVRDPRAVIASALPLDWGPTSARGGARWWLTWIGMGLAAEARFPERVLRVRYEDLVREPEPTLQRICAHLGLEFDPATSEGGGSQLPAYTQEQHALVGRPADPARIDAWQQKLSAEQVATIESELRDALTMLGYQRDTPSPTPVTAGSASEFLGDAMRSAQQRLRHRRRIRQTVKGEG
jgi:Sulfotransferase family